MNRKALFSTSLAIVTLLAGCSTLRTPAEQLFAPLTMALVSRPQDVTTPTANDSLAQFAEAIIWEEGLHGVAPDRVRGLELRRLAIQSRGTTPITQYTAAFNGQPSRVNLIHVPTGGLDPRQIAAVDECIASLRRGAPDACGDPETGERLLQLWRAARRAG